METDRNKLLALLILLLAVFVILFFPRTNDYEWSPFFKNQYSTLPDRTFSLESSTLLIDKPMIKVRNEDERNGFELIVHNKDINADSYPESILIKKLPPFKKSTTNGENIYSYDFEITDLKIIQNYKKENEQLLLNLTLDSIYNENSTLLSVSSRGIGYGFSLKSLTDSTYFAQTVEILECVLINPDRDQISDEIVIYWHPSKKSYQVTNTFGAPETFE